jgi:hypothetical protein
MEEDDDILSIESDKDWDSELDESIPDIPDEEGAEETCPRPKTSKGSRLKVDVGSVRPPSQNRPTEDNLDDIPITSMFREDAQRRNFMEEITTATRETARKDLRSQVLHSAKPSKNLVIKYNRKGGRPGDVRLPFETAIGKDFLKLFAHEGA